MSVKSDMMEIIDQATTQKTSAYDSTAEVTRVEGDTIWVHLAGGVTETPVRKTINARPGDTVQVRVSGGRAWIQGNETNPPTDDLAANKAAADAVRANAAAQSAVQSATTASVAAADAQEKATTASAAAATADSKATAASSAASRAESSASAASTAASQAVTDAAAAQTAANNAGQAASRAQAAADAAQGEIDDQQEYFWHDALGAHVLSDTDEVTGNRYRTDLKGAGQEIFELDGQNETSVASFGADGARLGETGGAHSVIDADGQRFYASDGTTQLANIGYGQGASASGTAVAPYYTFGTRESGSSVGNYSVAEGKDSIASAYCSHAEGSSAARQYYAHAEGSGTMASADSSHAEGGGTTANGIASHAEGYSKRSSGTASHAEGWATIASGTASHAEGHNTEATAYGAHAGGNYTIAAQGYQTVIGSYNIKDTETISSKQKAFIIGNGTKYARSNAFTVDWEGNTEAAGDISDGSGNKLSDRASTTKYGMTQLVNSYSSTATDKAATPYAVKQAYDLANRHKDYITEQGTNGEWTYRKWNSGKIEAWCEHAFGSQTGTVWTSFLRFKDLTLAIPTGIFTSEPSVHATSSLSQWQVWYANASSATSISVRCVTPVSASNSCTVSFYCVQQ